MVMMNDIPLQRQLCYCPSKDLSQPGRWANARPSGDLDVVNLGHQGSDVAMNLATRKRSSGLWLVAPGLPTPV